MSTAARGGGNEKRRVSFGEQRRNVIQLLKDRKNRYGGYVGGMKDFAEMGAHQGGNWPLSGESIKLKFGKPKRGQSQEDGEYFEHVKAATADLIDYMVDYWLAVVHPESYRCINEVFSADLSGDADWDQMMKDARPEVSLDDADWDNLTQYERDMWIAKKKRHLQRQRRYLQCEAGITLLTHEVWNMDLFVEFARRRTKEEDRANEQTNLKIYLEYEELTAPQGEGGQGLKSMDAYAQLSQVYGVGQPRLEQIVRSQRELAGHPPRKPGRPRKEKTA